MRSLSLNHIPTTLSDVFAISARVLLPTLFLLYAAVYFSAGQWVSLGLVFVAVLAVMNRVSRQNTVIKSNSVFKANIVATDGGSFRQVQPKRAMKDVQPVVYDGGIVKHRQAK